MVPADPVVPDAVVSELRTIAVAGMAGATCTVERATTTVGAGGATSTTFAPVVGLVDLPCSFRTVTAPLGYAAADGQRTLTTYHVRLAGAALTPGAPAIRPRMRLVIVHTRPGVPSPLVLSVVGDAPQSVGEVTRIVNATRLDPEMP